MANRPSQRPSNVAYYWRNRAVEIERVRNRQAATVAFLRDLRSSPCADCGGLFEPHQMDFDHRDSSLKSFRLTAGSVKLKSRAALEHEARKCDVVCANCHRVRTWKRHAPRPSPTGTSRYLPGRRALWRGQAQLLDRLRHVPCTDCGGSFHACSMDFDHRDPREKQYTVTRMIGRSGTERILAEVAKCDIVCANCHRLRTFERRMADRGMRE